MELVRKLAGTLTYLSPLEPQAAELWYRWHNDLETGLLAASPGHRTPGTLAEYQQTIARFLEQKAHAFLIVDAAADRPIGWCALFVIDPTSRRALLSALIGEKEYWGKGYGVDALRALIGYGFHIVNLNSIELVVHDDNARARRCYEKLGFQVVGRKRQARILGERKLDVLVMDLLAEEFAGPSPIPVSSR
jgi:RimJ/RimL family protein N-acetyltransferase